MKLEKVRALLKTDPKAAVFACTQLESALIKSNDPSVDMPAADPAPAQAELKNVLAKCQLGATDLQKIFTSTSISPDSTLSVLDNFNKCKKPLPINVAMIPFRKATYGSDFKAALEILDKTAGKGSNLAQRGESQIRKLALAWSTGVTGLLVGTNQLLESGVVGDWGSNRPMILAMVFAYASAVSVYSVLAWGGGNSSERSVGFVGGTPLRHRFIYRQELDMASELAQMNAALPENQGECAPKLLAQLKERNMIAIESKDEEMLKEYWARGGEGFDWVEPDQDPADIIWREKMDKLAHKRINTPYIRRINGKVHTWADSMQNIGEGRTIPHASLLNVEALRGPEKMDELEQELRKLRQDIKELPEESNENGDAKSKN